MTKQPFDIDVALSRIARAVEPFAKAGMFELADAGFCSVFEQLVACIISIRTYDEISVPAARRLFARARSAEAMRLLTPQEIDELIRPATFHGSKAAQIHAIARRTAVEFRGQLPGDVNVLLSFKGVGPKCAHLTLGVACGEPFISVDTHVHRVANRWGYVQAKTPERTMHALSEKLPRAHWVDINRLLVPFGKHICTAHRPHCSSCPVLDLCKQVGVKDRAAFAQLEPAHV